MKISFNKITILLILILVLAAFLRLYKISSYMEFLGDEGRDAIVARDILNGHFTLLGPRSSAGDFYMGPFYYYLISPFLLLFNYDPVGPAVMVALFGVATVFLIYKVASKFFDTLSGMFASALYAVSPLVLAYSHSSWNPDILPFFSLLLIYTVFKAASDSKSWKYFILIGVLLGISLQLHYLSLFLAVIIFVYIFLMSLSLRGVKRRSNPVSHSESYQIASLLLKNYIGILSGAIISLSPFFLFELRHSFLNTRGIFTFLFGTNVSYSTNANFFETVIQVFFRIFARLIVDFPVPAKTPQFTQVQLISWGAFAMLLAVGSITVLFLQKKKPITLLLGLWLFLSVFLFGFYKKEIYDYLFTFIFPLPFLLVGNLLSYIFHFPDHQLCHSRAPLRRSQYPWGKRGRHHEMDSTLVVNPVVTNKYAYKKYLTSISIKDSRVFFMLLSLIIFFVIFAISLLDNPFRYEPNKQRDQTKGIAQFVISKADNKPYNFALLSKGNSDFGYRYYLELLGHPPVLLENLEKDPKRQSVTKQLLIVCEDIYCNSIGNPLHDVAAFGQAEITGVWDVSVVKIYKLVPYKEK